MRAQLLGLAGYDVQLVEFVELEHTPKNVLIRARTAPRTRHGRGSRASTSSSSARSASTRRSSARSRDQLGPARWPVTDARARASGRSAPRPRRARGEPLGGTASRVEHWLLVEYGGYWPYDPLDATVFAGGLREHARGAARSGCRTRACCSSSGPGAGAPRARPARLRLDARARRAASARSSSSGHPDLLAARPRRDAARRGRRRVGEPLDHPLLLVCTHGKRDRCCARYGQALCRRPRTSARRTAGSGRRATSAATGSRATSSACRRASTSAGVGRTRPRACSRGTSRARSTSSATAAARATRSRCRRPSAQVRARARA